MSMTNRERVRQGLDELKGGLTPLVERELRSLLGADRRHRPGASNKGVAS